MQYIPSDRLIGILLSSFFFSVGAFFALVIYAVFVVLYQHHVHVARQVLRALMIMAVHLVLATIIAAFFLFPVAYTLLHGRDDTTSTIRSGRSCCRVFTCVILPTAHSPLA